jgi:hypothetical protein
VVQHHGLGRDHLFQREQTLFPPVAAGAKTKGDLYLGCPVKGVLGSLRYKDGKPPATNGELLWEYSVPSGVKALPQGSTVMVFKLEE